MRSGLLLLIVLSSFSVDAAERPNVVILFTVDQGTLDANCYGSTDLITPNIDKLAKTGVLFTQAYSHTVCCPARAALLTGRHPQRGGVYLWTQGNMNGADGINMFLEEVTLAEVLQRAGYRTALFGKWHLGAHRDFGPKKQGFDEFFGIRDGFIDNYNHYFLHGSGFHDLYEGTESVEADGKYFPEMMVQRSLKFIDENKDKPFFLYVPFNIPHYPEQALKQHALLYKDMQDPARRSYGAIVTTTDHYIGQIVDRIESHGLRDNTIILYLSDNGHSEETGNRIRVDNHKSGYSKGHFYGASGDGSTGKWIGQKGSFLEGGVRVPTIISYPTKLPQGAVRDQIVTAMDWFPTLLELCGVAQANNAPRLDGHNVLPIIADAKTESKHQVLHFAWSRNWAVREGDWKLIGINNNKRFTLHNLADEKPEAKNHAGQKPKVVARLRKLHEAWVKDVTPKRKTPAVDTTKLKAGNKTVATKKPNIIYIMADDQGFGDVSALNPDSKIPTPNIDRIAAEGMIFSDGHSSSSVCTPTRYSVLTGRYHWRTHLQRGVLGGFSKPLISPGRLTVASLLKQHGYSTACIGKWHLGWDWPLKKGGTANDKGNFSGGFKGGWDVDYKGKIKNGPCDLGFDTFFGISASLDMPPYVYVRDRTPTEPATVEKAFHRKGPAAAGFEAVDVLPTITKEAVQFINDSAKSGRPFFLYFPLNAPHTPILPTKKWKGKSGINKYADFTMQVDWTVGQVLKAIDDNKISKNTLVIFTTDNGCSPAAKIPELEAAGHDQNYIYRGHKADIFEGGHRVPFVARWPNKVKAGSRTSQLIGQLDLLATAADIVGAKVNKNSAEDSVSFLPVLLGEATKPIRTSIVSQSIGGQFAIRDGDWKLCLCPGSGGWSAPRPGRSDFSKLPPIQLYNLAADPGETNNLQAQHPDRVAKMKDMLRQLINNGRSTPGPRLKNDVKVVMIKPIAKSRTRAKKKKKK